MPVLNGLEDRLEAENIRPGRPRTLSVSQLFTLLMCMQLTKRAAHLSGVVTMHQDLHPTDRSRLGIGGVLTSNHVRYLFDRVSNHLALDTDVPDNEPGKSSNDNVALQNLLDEFASTSDAVSSTYKRDVAIDGTRIPIPARAKGWVDQPGSKSKRARFADPDITFHAMPTTEKGNTNYRSAQGFGATTIVTVGGEDGVPQTTVAFSVADMTMTYTQEGVLGIPLLGTLDRVATVDAIFMDTGYSYHEDFRAAVRRHGLRPHMPLHPNHQGPHEIWDGVTATADVVVCPGTPSTLLSIKGLNGNDLTAAVSERSAFELRRHGRRSGQSGQRFGCPARAGKVRCPLYPQSLRLPLSVPTVTHPPQIEHKVCVQETTTLPESMLTFLQDDPIGTAAHAQRMGGRQTVESSYRQLKSLTSGGLTRDAIAVRGLVRFALMLSTIVAAENVRRLVSKVGKFLDQSDGVLARQFRWLDLTSPVLKGIRSAAGVRAPPPTGA